MKVKQIIREVFPGLVSIRNRIYNYFAHYRFKNLSTSQVFETIYKENHWRDSESKSGTGSNNEQTAEVRNIIATVVQGLNCKTFLDIPCGDFNWMKDVKMENCKYYGADIVEELIIHNNKNYSNDFREFLLADLTTSELPPVDLIFCRDCLVHLSYDNIRKAIVNMKKSGSKFLLTTTFTQHSNINIITGDWRPINLERKPFLFPAPQRLFNEKCAEGDGRYADKSLALWSIKDLPS